MIDMCQKTILLKVQRVCHEPVTDPGFCQGGGGVASEVESCR